jgi:site-specific DNA recombinase
MPGHRTNRFLMSLGAGEALIEVTDMAMLTRLRAYLEMQGERLRPEWIFRDDGYSGATLNRPGLDRLRDAVRSAEVDHVLITTPDRLARHYVHQMVLLEELERGLCRGVSRAAHEPRPP